jgi:hypothetical protein
MCEGWALSRLHELGAFVARLADAGFEVEVEDVSWQVLPSLLHIPATVLAFRLRSPRDLDPRRLATSRASMWCLACALLRPRCFGYFLITARRR